MAKSARLKKHWLRWIALAFVLLLAAIFRFSALNWDSGTHVHPDERYLSFLASLIHTPASLVAYFDSAASPLNPFNTDWGKSYVYGTLPLFIARVAGEWLDRACQSAWALFYLPSNALFSRWLGTCAQKSFTDYDGITYVGRLMSALFDWLTVLLVALVGIRLSGWGIGIIAAALSACAAMQIQQAHFFTVDSATLFFATTAFAGVIGVVRSQKAGQLWLRSTLTGVMIGAALASKISVWMLFLFALLAILLVWINSEHFALWHVVGAFVILTSATFFVFRVTQPYAFIGVSEREFIFTLQRCNTFTSGNLLNRVCSAMADLPLTLRALFAPSGRWIEQLALAQAFVDGTVDAPFGIQWANRLPIIFPLINLVFWGMGVPLGIASIAGVIFVLCRREREIGWLFIALWCVVFFAYQGTQWTKSIRYQLPIYPWLSLCAALLLQHVCLSRAARAIRPIMHIVVIGGTLLWAIAFTAIYRQPLTRVAATEWMQLNIPPHSVVANEHWDDPLPLSTIDGGFTSNTFRHLSNESGLMQMYDADTPQKKTDLLTWLDQADYLVLSSNRIYASVARLPWRYPLTLTYYRALFAGKLGFELVGDFRSLPRIGAIAFDTQEMPQALSARMGDLYFAPYPPAEEAFSVYDHPRVLIFKKSPAYTRERAADVFASVDLDSVVEQSPRAAANAPSGMLMSDALRTAQALGGTWRVVFDQSEIPQWLALIEWLVLIELLGIAFVPIALRMFGDSVFGAGVAFAKILALLIVAWMCWICASVQILPFSRGAIVLVSIFALVANAYLFRRMRAARAILKSKLSEIALAEGVFLLAFACFTAIRVGNPDLWHPIMGGEKPMDFAYFNAVLRSTYFPPYDPWFAGGYINYYYFGWVVFGVPVKLLGLAPSVAYNLILPTIVALVASAAFAIGATFARHSVAYATRRAELLAGVLSAALIVALGNLGQLDVILNALRRLGAGSPLQGATQILNGAPLPLAINEWYWNATRLDATVPIAEFPLFTFLYADLHAHMMAMPLFLLAVALLLVWVNRSRADGILIFVTALAIGALWATNSWDYPLVTLMFVAAVALRIVFVRAQNLFVIGAQLIAVILLSVLFFAPYREHYGAAYTAVGRWAGDTTPLDAYLKIYLLFAAPIAMWAMLRAISLWRTSQLSTAIGAFALALSLAASAVFAWFGVSVTLVALPMMALCAFAMLQPQPSLVARLIWGMGVVAFALSVFVELFTLRGDIGRMNTVFKMYLQAWLLLSFVAAIAITKIVYARIEMDASASSASVRALSLPKRATIWLRRGSLFIIAALLITATLYPLTAVPAKMQDRFSTTAPHGLDGSTYMQTARYDEAIFGNAKVHYPLESDYDAIRWLQVNVVGSPVIIEGQTGFDLYRWGNRFSIYTGLPTIVGWNWHERQQRAALPDKLVVNRANDVAEFYNTSDVYNALMLIHRYQAKYVIVGELERGYYTPLGIAKFQRMQEAGWLRAVYRNEGVTIYEVLATS